MSTYLNVNLEDFVRKNVSNFRFFFKIMDMAINRGVLL